TPCAPLYNASAAAAQVVCAPAPQVVCAPAPVSVGSGREAACETSPAGPVGVPHRGRLVQCQRRRTAELSLAARPVSEAPRRSSAQRKVKPAGRGNTSVIVAANERSPPPNVPTCKTAVAPRRIAGAHGLTRVSRQ